MKIKELCTEERPREKMASKGAGALTNAELLAILIGSGTQKENVLEVANRLLARSEGRLGAIASMTVQDMSETDGIGPGGAPSSQRLSSWAREDAWKSPE